MLVNPALRMLLSPSRPDVKVFDVRSSDGNLTTYTFSSSRLPDLGSVMSGGGAPNTGPVVPSSGRKIIVVIVHAEDSATLFSVNSVSLGGVSGTEVVDRGGATSAINTAIYFWTTDALRGIADSDVVVTMSEAVTACAVGILEVSNLSFGAIVDGVNTTDRNTTPLIPRVQPTIESDDVNLCLISGTTLIGTGESALTSNIINGGPGTNSSAFPPTLLYEGSNAEFSWAAAWSFTRSYGAGSRPVGFYLHWSGAGAGDAVSGLFR